MRTLRRALAAVAVAAATAATLRLQGNSGVPRRAGGWRPLAGPRLR